MVSTWGPWTQFIQWLAPKSKGLKTGLSWPPLPTSSRRLHLNTPSVLQNCVGLMVAFELFLGDLRLSTRHSLESKRRPSTKNGSARIGNWSSTAISKTSEDPAIRFLSLIGGALISGRAFSGCSNRSCSGRWIPLWMATSKFIFCLECFSKFKKHTFRSVYESDGSMKLNWCLILMRHLRVRKTWRAIRKMSFRFLKWRFGSDSPDSSSRWRRYDPPDH